MKPYKNLHGDSGVAAYEAGDTSIAIRFCDGGTYLYTYASTGKRAVETMKRRARQGGGLATYINRHVRGAYARKL